MRTVLFASALFVLVAHGLIHFMGTAVYMKLANVQGLSYKTTVLGGRWDLGAGGMWIFGALWILPAVGFIAVALALMTGSDWWRPMLVGMALLSLALTALDWDVAFMGAIVDVVILAVLWLAPWTA